MTPQTFESTLITGAASLVGTVTDASGSMVRNVRDKAYANGPLAAETKTDANGDYEFRSLPEGPVLLQIEAQGFQRTVINGSMIAPATRRRQDSRLQVGNINQTISVTASAPSIQTESAEVASIRSRSGGSGRTLGGGSGLGGSSRTGANGTPGGVMGRVIGGVSDARARAESAALAQERGDLFEYKLKEPITIQKNRSALVPIVQSSLTAEKVSIWNDHAGLPRPQRALWLTNSSGLTLDGGSFSGLEEETFAGEGVLEPIRPNEKRLVSYATDLALTAGSREASDQQRVSRVYVRHGVMTHVSEIREKKTYTFRNEDNSARTVIVEHPVRSGYELRGEIRPVETTAGWMRFRLQVEPKQTASLVVDEARPVHATYELTNITDEQVGLFIREKSIDKTVEHALRRILAQKAVVAYLSEKKDDREIQMEKIFDDQQRLRENMKTLKGSAEEKALLQRYTQQLNEQETRLYL